MKTTLGAVGTFDFRWGFNWSAQTRWFWRVMWLVMMGGVAWGQGTTVATLPAPWFFDRPLVAVAPSPTLQSEAAALQLAIQASASGGATSTVALLEAFVADYPQSVWTPSLLCGLGHHAHVEGMYSTALNHWAQVWELTQHYTDGPGKDVADYALAWWTRLLVELGRVDDLQVIFQQVGNRCLDAGALQQMFIRTREKYAWLQQWPALTYRCGWLVVDGLLSNTWGQGLPPGSLEAFYQESSLFGSCSMQALAQLAQSQQVSLVGVERPAGVTNLPVPSIMHFSASHFVALLGWQTNGLVRALDPVVGYRFFQPAALNEEASGRFLVPANQVPVGWSGLSTADMSATLGRCWYFPGAPDDSDNDSCDSCPTCPPGANSQGNGPNGGGPDAGGPPDQNSPDNLDPLASHCSGCSGTEEAGMPRWRVSEPNINLWLVDQPVSSKPAYGRSVPLKLRFKQRDEHAGYVQSAFFFGAGWNCNWFSYVDCSDWSTGSLHVRLPGGGWLTYGFTTGQTTAFDYVTNSRLTITVAGQAVTQCVLDLADGREYIYNYVYAANSHIYMTASLDTEGFATYYTYNVPNSRLHLNTVTDQVGTTLYTLSYTASTYSDVVTGIVDRFNRSVTLGYDSYNSANPHLTQITDAAGLVSSFTYDATSGWPLTMTTPYGTTTFCYHGVDESQHEGLGWYRLINITEPNSGQQMYLFVADATSIWSSWPTQYSSSYLPSNLPSNKLDSSLEYLNSFFWNQNQVADAQALGLSSDPTQITPSVLTITELNLARLRHWLSPSDYYNGYPAGVDSALSTERAPSPDASGSTWGQITWYDYAGKDTDYKARGTQIMPSLIARKLPDGSTWYESYQRNAWGLASSKTGTYGTGSPAATRSYAYAYDSNNGIDLLSIAITSPESHTLASYTYNSRHEVLTETHYANDSASFTTTTTYDTQGRTSTRTTPAGVLSTYSYGSDNYLANVVDTISGTPLRTNSFTWTSGYVQTQTDSRGLTRTFTRDGLNRLTQVQYSDDNSTKQYSYSLASGQGFNNSGSAISILDVAAVKDRLGNWTYYGRDRLRRVVTVTDPLNHITHYDYCACGGVDSITDALGTNATLYGYNNAGWRISVTHPDGHGEQYAYDALGRVITRTDALGSRSYTYNNQGLLASVTTSYGTEKAVTYDAYDRPQTVTDANGVSVTSGYDRLGRVLTRTYPDSGVEYLGYAYDFRSPAGYTNQVGDIVLTAYDAAGRKTNEVHAGVDTNRFTYSPGSDLLTLTDSKAQVTTWAYDVEGRVGGKYDASGTLILGYWYDANSRVTTRWSKAKNYTTYQYDNAGNLLYVNYPASPQLGFTYDADNRLTQIVDGVGTTVYGYSYDRLGSEDGPWANDTVSFTYNNAQLRSGLTLQQPVGSWSQSYSYDAADRLYSLTSPPGSFSYTYRGPGTVWTNLALPNTAVITNVFDSVARLTQTTLRSSGGTVLNRHSYQVNQANERWQMGRTDGSTVNYNYNGAQELIKALGNGGSSTENLGYGYDAAWNLNLRTNSGVVKTFTVNNLNELTSDGTYTYGYDGNGNRGSRSDGLAYVYDDENQLVSVSSSASWQSTFGYDGLGRMRVRREYTWSATGGVVAPAPVVTAATPGSPLRNDFSGWVGMRFQVATSPLVVTELGRWVVSGNSQTHAMKLVQANGTDLAGGATVVNTSGATAGQFVYASLAAPVTLSANTTYYVVSQEASGGDQWYNYPNGTMVFNGLANGTGAAWAYNNSTTYYVGPNLPQSYVPVNFKGTSSSIAPLASVGTITSSLRNDFSGWVGFQFEVGSVPITVTSLGRWVVSGNSGTHAVKLVNADGTDVSNGGTTVRTAGMTTSQFAYAPLPAPVTLSAYTTYFLVSQESSGGDQWYDYANTPITITAAGGALAISAPNGSTTYTLASNGSGRTFGPLNLEFASGLTGGSWAVAQEVHYVYDGRRVIQERDGSNTPQVSYTRGKDLSGTLEGAGGIAGLLARSSAYNTGTGGWGTHDYYHADGNGNVTFILDTNQAMAASYEYDPYGNLLSSNGTLASANVYRFSSKEFHASSGLYYYGLRFYDPLTQRWLSRDPIQELGGANLYGFESNSPLTYYDSIGTHPFDWIRLLPVLWQIWNPGPSAPSAPPLGPRGSPPPITQPAQPQTPGGNPTGPGEPPWCPQPTTTPPPEVPPQAGLWPTLVTELGGPVSEASAGTIAGGVAIAAAGGFAGGYLAGHYITWGGDSLHEHIGGWFYHLCPSCFY